MKSILVTILTLLISSCVTQNNDSAYLQLNFPEEYKKSFNIEVIIVEKPNTYMAQNYTKLPFYIKVIKVNGKEIQNKDPLPFVTTRKLDFKIGSTQNLSVYESVEEILGEAPPSFSHHYNVRHRMVLRDLEYDPDPLDPFNTDKEK